METNLIIIRPIITEKSMSDSSKGRYTFVVAEQAEKQAIRKAIEQKFNVKVMSIKTRITKGRKHRVGKLRQEVLLASIKKATVNVQKGQTIALFDVGEKK